MEKWRKELQFFLKLPYFLRGSLSRTYRCGGRARAVRAGRCGCGNSDSEVGLRGGRVTPLTLTLGLREVEKCGQGIAHSGRTTAKVQEGSAPRERRQDAIQQVQLCVYGCLCKLQKSKIHHFTSA